MDTHSTKLQSGAACLYSTQQKMQGGIPAVVDAEVKEPASENSNGGSAVIYTDGLVVQGK